MPTLTSPTKSLPKSRLNRLHIVLTNDDGVEAPGLHALAEALSIIARVTVVAPDRERSTSGRALTMHKPLRVYRQPSWPSSRSVWKTNGTPADCVKLALRVILKKDTVDLVVAGINRGANLGSDVLYSGTAAAAFEAAMLDVPAIAVSLANPQEKNNFRSAARFAARFVSKYFSLNIPPDTIVNINVPDLPAKSIRGVKWSKLGVRKYTDIVDERRDPKGHIYYWLSGEPRDGAPRDTETDVAAVARGYISLTPVGVTLTDFESLERMRSTWTD